MAPLLLTVTGLLAVLVLLVGALALRLRSRVADLERRLAGSPRSSDAPGSVQAVPSSPFTALDEPRHEYVITRVGEAEPEVEPLEPVPTVEASLFADAVLRETVLKAAALAHGLRRALSPETRNRIRFEMKREVKRSRKQRRTEMRAARRDGAARQRADLADDLAEDTAA